MIGLPSLETFVMLGADVVVVSTYTFGGYSGGSGCIHDRTARAIENPKQIAERAASVDVGTIDMGESPVVCSNAISTPRPFTDRIMDFPRFGDACVNARRLERDPRAPFSLTYCTVAFNIVGGKTPPV